MKIVFVYKLLRCHKYYSPFCYICDALLFFAAGFPCETESLRNRTNLLRRLQDCSLFTSINTQILFPTEECQSPIFKSFINLYFPEFFSKTFAANKSANA